MYNIIQDTHTGAIVQAPTIMGFKYSLKVSGPTRVRAVRSTPRQPSTNTLLPNEVPIPGRQPHKCEHNTLKIRTSKEI